MAFTYRLEHPDGKPADPANPRHRGPHLETRRHHPRYAPGRTLRVVQIRPGRDPGENGVLVVEPV
jgi:hypothetical protein